MPWRDEWKAFPNEDWYNGDNELIDRVFVQERRNELAASHHADGLGWLAAKAFGKRTNRLRDEFDASRHGCRRRLAREHVVPVARAEGCAHLDTQVEGLATEELGVDRAREFRHAVEPFRGGPTREPVQAAVGTGDVAVSACCGMGDDLSFLCHVDTDCAGAAQAVQGWWKE